jgi:hypothetical protein
MEKELDIYYLISCFIKKIEREINVSIAELQYDEKLNNYLNSSINRINQDKLSLNESPPNESISNDSAPNVHAQNESTANNAKKDFELVVTPKEKLLLEKAQRYHSLTQKYINTLRHIPVYLAELESKNELIELQKQDMEYFRLNSLEIISVYEKINILNSEIASMLEQGKKKCVIDLGKNITINIFKKGKTIITLINSTQSKITLEKEIIEEIAKKRLVPLDVYKNYPKFMRSFYEFVG